jgi:branched-chain amino acid transport system ATP-binding protein
MSPTPQAPVLVIEGLTKRFGGLTAVDNFTLAFAPRRLHAIIGPNGAGKTTLFNLISGFLPSDEGRVFFAGQEISRLKPHKISRLGISRTLQVKSVFGQLSVSDNLWITAQAQHGVMNPFRPTASYRQTCEKVERVLEQLGLTALANRQAGTLSYGDTALLEIGMAIAAEPKLLLLDEPICGMSPAETERTVVKIRELAQTIDIVLIEHDMEVVFEIADDITVMAQGAVLASGSPKQIAADERVREAYLGRPEDEDYIEEAVRA